MWTENIFKSVYARLKANGTILIKQKFPKLTPNFSDATPSAESIKYPCIVIKQLPSMEKARDIEGAFVNEVLSSIQIDVMTNTKQSEANSIAYIMADLMKGMRYEMVGEPHPMDSQLNDYRNVSNYRRNVDYNDII